jgi:hypothetical protein
LWLEEGFADFVAYQGSGLSTATVSADLLPSLRRGQVPAHLPTSQQFDPGRGPIAAAYVEAWLACKLIASSGDSTTMVNFYRTAAGLALQGGSTGAGTTASSTDAALATAFSSVVGTDQGAFELRWRAYLLSVAKAAA